MWMVVLGTCWIQKLVHWLDLPFWIPGLQERSREEGGDWGRVSKLICSSIVRGTEASAHRPPTFPGSPEGELASARLLPVVKSTLPCSSFVYFVFDWACVTREDNIYAKRQKNLARMGFNLVFKKLLTLLSSEGRASSISRESVDKWQGKGTMTLFSAKVNQVTKEEKRFSPVREEILFSF